LAFNLANRHDVEVRGRITMTAADGWTVEPAAHAFTLAPEGKAELASVLDRQGSIDVGKIEAVELHIEHADATDTFDFTTDVRRAVVDALPPVRMTLKRTDAAVTVDGHAREDLWQGDPVTGPFMRPNCDGPIKHQTRVYGAWDAEHLYLFWQIDEPAVDKLRARVQETDEGDGRDDEDAGEKAKLDAPVWNDDAVEVMLDTNADAKTYVQLGVSASGARYAARPRESVEFVPALRVAVVKDAAAGRWQGEMAVPWADLVDEPPQPGRRMRVCFARTRRADGDGTVSQYPALFGWNHTVKRYADLILE
jgi:hypothetical protein